MNKTLDQEETVKPNPKLFRQLTKGLSNDELAQMGWVVYLSDGVYLTKDGNYISDNDNKISQMTTWSVIR